jgi:SAM-dependent methyltransferase
MDGQTASVSNAFSEADLLRFCAEIFPPEPMYDLLVNEARFGLSRTGPVLALAGGATAEVLEVGAGSCILSAYLASTGLHVTAVEPLGAEFDFFAEVQERVLDFCRRRSLPLQVLRMTGEQLNLPGRFDVAFTINALEHMRDPLRTLDNMHDSLKPGGVLLAHCPNYTIPFEVHFNVFLVTRSKSLNAWLYRSKIDRYPRVWDGLNFIRYIDVRRHLARRRASFVFAPSVMHDLLRRLLDDPVFARRMPPIVRAIGAVLRYSGLLHALTLVPARLQTPMEVLIKRAAHSE